jgi:small subunit ribosomal protein S17
MAEEPENNVEEPEAAEAEAGSEAPRADDAESEAAASDASASEPPTASDAEPEAHRAEEAKTSSDAPGPKERRRRGRAAKAAAIPARRPRSAEERQAEREAERRRKATVRSGRRVREREKARAARSGAPTPEPLATRREKHPGQQKTRQGIVVSDRASKTIVVRIDVARRHPRYEKIVRTSTTLHAHDEREDAHVGDTVIVRESRPLSRSKRWRLVEVVERAE